MFGWVGQMYLLWLLMGEYFLFIRNCWRSIFFYNGMRGKSLGWGIHSVGGLNFIPFQSIPIEWYYVGKIRETNKYVFICFVGLGGWKIQFESSASYTYFGVPLLSNSLANTISDIHWYVAEAIIDWIHTYFMLLLSLRWHSSPKQQQQNWTFDGTTFRNWITKFNFPSVQTLL